jgi:hypothetical protein
LQQLQPENQNQHQTMIYLLPELPLQTIDKILQGPAISLIASNKVTDQEVGND